MEPGAADTARVLDGAGAFVAEVRALVEGRLAEVVARVGLAPDCLDGLLGKLLRSRFGARLVGDDSAPATRSAALAGCAAVELLHTATLCHDDVIDRSTLRRHRPTLWRATNTAGAILVGDLLLTESLRLLREHGSSAELGLLLAKIAEICEAELELEFRQRGRAQDRETWLRLARRKTGALFAFVGRSCSGGDDALGAALEEAGYRLGTAYQVLDDLVDVLGSEAQAGKTLRRDAERGVVTRLVVDADPARAAARELREQCRHALDAVAAWPRAQQAVARFLGEDLEPLLRLAGTGVSERMAPLAE